MEELQNFPAQPLTPAPEPQDDRPSIGKQVLGAVIGGALALGLYYAYDFAKPKVAAYLTLPVAEGGRMYDVGDTNIADKSLEDDERKRFASKNAQAAARMQGKTFDTSAMKAVDDHSTDISWQGHKAKQEVNTAIGQDAQREIVVRVMEKEMATQEPNTSEGAWDVLWGDIADREDTGGHESMDRSNADGLPDTGFGLGVIAIGAAGGAWGARKKMKKL